jgi:NAD(P)-dependent dehydrogenase (short-subunit alcohol dehydrogenase family)
MQLRGGQALITCGSSEIGRAVALALAEAGAAGVAVDYVPSSLQRGARDV